MDWKGSVTLAALGVRRVRGGGWTDAVRLGAVTDGEFDLRGLRGALCFGEAL